MNSKNQKEKHRIINVAVECDDIYKKTKSEGSVLILYWRWGMKVRVSNRGSYPSSSSSQRWELYLRYWRIKDALDTYLGITASALNSPPGD